MCAEVQTGNRSVERASVGSLRAAGPAVSARYRRGGCISGSSVQAAARMEPALPRNTHRWSETDLQKEKARLVAWLDDRAAKGLGVPSSRARPDRPHTTLIAKGAEVRRSAISLETGHLKALLNQYVERIKLQPYQGPAGVHFERSDRVHEALVTFIESRKASGLGLPSMNGRPNMAAIARGAGISPSTLTDTSHRNHRLVMEKFESMGGGTEDTKRAGPLVLAELLRELEA
jgi:hypothetical protein